MSPDGTWEFGYPPSWSLQGGPTVPVPGAQQGWTWTLKNYTPTTDSGPLTDGKIKIDLDQLPNDRYGSLEDVLDEMCDTSVTTRQREKALECRMIELNGRTWARAVIQVTSGEGEGSRFMGMATIANGYVYQASGLAPTGGRQASGIAEIEKIFRSFIVR